MKYLSLLARASAVLASAAVIVASAYGQSNVPAESMGGPLTGPPVFGAPFSANATTTVHATLGDGTRLDQSMTDRYYRDSAGRVRVERSMDGLPAPSTVSERHIRTIMAPEPGDRWVYTIDAQTQTVRLHPRSIVGYTVGGGRWFGVPVGGVRFVDFKRAGDLLSADPSAFADVRDELLGSRRIAGVETTGRRITLVVAPGSRHNSQAIEMTDERWESDELKLLIQSWHSDSRSTIEYRLSNIHRDEPPAHLFQIPPDYTTSIPTSDPKKDPIMSFTAPEGFRRESRSPYPPRDDARQRSDTRQ
jgi:hypothetical protein